MIAVLPFGDLQESLRSEGALGVDPQAASLRASLVHRQLAVDGERVAQLTLPGAELAVDLKNDLITC